MRAVILGLFVIFTSSFAGAGQIITDATGLEYASTPNGSEFTLGTDSYLIDGQVDFHGKSLIVDTAGTTLTIESAPTSDYQLRVENFTVNVGEVNLSGDTSTNTALLVRNNFIQNGGEVNAKANGGNAIRGYGNPLEVENQFDYTLNDGTLNVTGSVYDGVNAIGNIASFTMNGGFLNARGGNSEGSSAFSNPERLEITNGTARFIGGGGLRGKTSHGVMEAVDMYISGETTVVEVIGGGGEACYGIYGHRDNSVLNVSGGTIRARGGSGQQSRGMHFVTMNQTDGNISAQGGSERSTHGFSLVNANLSGGTLTATAGTGDSAWGLYTLGNIVQNAGTLIGKAGDDNTSIGIFCTGSLDQLGGHIIAVGGLNKDGNGLYLNGSGSAFSGILEMECRGDIAAVYSEQGVTFRTGSTVRPVISLDGNGDHIAGLLLTAAGKTVDIQSGVTVQPVLANANDLRESDGKVPLLFIDTQGGTITNYFDKLVDSATLGFTAEKRGQDKYYLTVWRKADVQSLLPRDLPHRNGNSIIDSIGSFLEPGNTCGAMQRVWDHLDNSPTVEELHARARRIGKTLAPEAYADMPKVFLHMLDMVDTRFLRELETSVPDAAGGQWRIWADPMFHQSMRNRAKTAEFEHSQDKFYGTSFGVSREWDRVAIGMEGHYLRGSYDASCSRIDSDNFGLRFGARMGNPVPAAAALSFSPWAAFSLGYDHSRMDQRNTDYFGGIRTSKPAAHMATAKIEAGHGFQLGGNLLFTPIAGLEYSHIRQNGYRDRGSSDYLLRVGGNSYHSLRFRAGLRAETRLAEQTYLSVRGDYRFEAMDTYASFDSVFATCPGVTFNARGENRSRSSGVIGAGLRHTVGRTQLSADYDLTLESRYLAHRIGLGVAVNF